MPINGEGEIPIEFQEPETSSAAIVPNELAEPELKESGEPFERMEIEMSNDEGAEETPAAEEEKPEEELIQEEPMIENESENKESGEEMPGTNDESDEARMSSQQIQEPHFEVLTEVAVEKYANEEDGAEGEHMGLSGDDEGDLIQKLEDEMNDYSPEDDNLDIEAIHKEEEIPVQQDHFEEATSQRDERGQSVLHFAASRPGGGQTLLAFLRNPTANLAWRDEKLRTAKDVAIQLGRHENATTIDSWIVSLAVSGELETLQKLMIDGYDDFEVKDSNQINLITLVEKAEQPAIVHFLKSVPEFHSRLEVLLRNVRSGGLDQVKELLNSDRRLCVGMGKQGRAPLHVAVLMEQYSIVQYLASNFPETLKRGDNLERTPLHFAMGVEKVEKMTRILVRAGAKRMVKDLLGRQPSFYYLNREQIVLLQEEEDRLKHKELD